MREMLTREISKVQMWEELLFLIATLDKLGHRKIKAAFGFQWAETFRAGWDEIAVSGSELISEVRRLERSKQGQLGLDDLHIRVPKLNVEFQFCNDSDIHLRFKQPSELTESFYLRWEKRGFAPKA